MATLDSRPFRFVAPADGALGGALADWETPDVWLCNGKLQLAGVLAV